MKMIQDATNKLQTGNEIKCQEDIEKALLNGEIIEEYENDYPYPSCLVYGINLNNKVIHIVCGINEIELWIITAY